MPLYDQFPYSNIHELNLNWIISKLKDVDKAQTAAQDVVALVDRAEAAAASAERDAENAHDDADSANHDWQLARAASEAAEGYRDDALGYKNDAKGYADSAALDADAANRDASDAHTDAVAAAGSASSAHDDAADAHSDALAAAGSAAAALADADRAQLYGASTGVMAYAGQISAGSAADVACGDGSYAVIYFADDTDNSSGLIMCTLKNDQVTYRGRVIAYNGHNITVVSVASTGLRIINSMGDGDLRFLIVGRAD